MSGTISTQLNSPCHRPKVCSSDESLHHTSLAMSSAMAPGVVVLP